MTLTPDERAEAEALFVRLGTPCREHCTEAMRNRDIELIAEFRRQGQRALLLTRGRRYGMATDQER